MTIRQSFAAGTALVAVAVGASPALAAQEMSYEQTEYEFAQPLPAAEAHTVFTSEPVVQAIPAPTTYRTASPYPVSYEREVEVVRPASYHGTVENGGYTPPMPGHAQPIPQPVPQTIPAPQTHQTHQVPTVPQHYPSQPHAHTQAPHYPAQPVAHHGGPPLPPAPSFDRSGWLDNCEDELRRRKNRGATTGGLLGAIAGGVIGNRVADSERLGGTLIGAGVGGLAGLAIGSAIGSAVGGNPYLKECKAYLENWERGGYGQGGYAQGGYGQHAYGYGYGHQGYGYGYQAYTYVPAMAYVTTYPISRPVIREYVTEEWVDVPVEHVEYETVTVHHPAPQPVRYIKQKPVTHVKYIKGQ